MQSIAVSDETLLHLRQAAALRGIDADTYAEELLSLSLTVLREKAVLSTTKPYQAMQFSGVAPTGRTAAEIDSEIESGRDEWDKKVAGRLSLYADFRRT